MKFYALEDPERAVKEIQSLLNDPKQQMDNKIRSDCYVNLGRWKKEIEESQHTLD